MNYDTLLSQYFTSNHPRSGRFPFLIGMLTVSLMAVLTFGLNSRAVAQAQTYYEQPLYSFTGGSDGADPHGDLIAVNGILYGTTEERGIKGDGTIFSYNLATNTETTLYEFTSTGGDGAFPAAGMLNVNGIFYGTTIGGGGSGYGTIFAFDPSNNSVTILHSFSKTSGDGAYPESQLTLAGSKLYGTTSQGGGSNNSGMVFAINPDATGYQELYSFQGTSHDGATPIARLSYINGILYGTTQMGGANSDGTVFSIDPTTGVETDLHDLGSDGYYPWGGVTNVNGTIFGVTADAVNNGGIYGPGTLFFMKPDGTNFHNFHPFSKNGIDGQTPFGSLIEANGLLYGTAYLGGYANSGTVFSVDPTTTVEQTLYEFLGPYSDGSLPTGSLLSLNGTLYGTTSSGGNPGYGTIFALIPAPIAAVADSYSTSFETPCTVSAPGMLANDNSKGTGTLSATLVAPPTHGTVVLNSDGSFVYTPKNGFAGTDRFLYYATTASGRSNNAGVLLTVKATTPVANADSYTSDNGNTLIVNAPGVLANDNPGDTGTLTAALVSNASHGTVTLQSDGSFTYKPNAGFTGTDSFTYHDTNTLGTGNTATVTITVQGTLPIANNDTYTLSRNTTLTVAAPGVLGNDTNPVSGSMTAALVTGVSHGSLTLNADGSFVYSPNAGFIGSDSFTYKDTNSVGTGNTATVTLTVQATAPIAVNNSNNVKADTPFTVPAPGVLGNDDNGGSSPMTASLVSTVSHGILTLNSNGAFTYTPAQGFIGTDSFTYQAVNSVGKSNVATATLIVQAGVPTAINNSNNVKADTPFTVPTPGVLGNDYDGGSPMTAQLVSGVSHGTLTLSSNGAFTYTPAHGFIGTDSFTYQAVNSFGKSNIATATLYVQAGVPTAVNNSNNVKKNTPFTVPAPGVLGNDYDGGSPMTALLVTTTAHGTLTLSSNGAFTYTPNTNFTGTDSFTYQAVNSVGKSNIATATLNVQ